MPLRKKRARALAVGFITIVAVGIAAAPASAASSWDAFTITFSPAVMKAVSAVAGANGTGGCVAQSTTQAYKKWGDTAAYAPAPGGTFEGAHGWTLGDGAKITTGNDGNGVASGSKSLSMAYGGYAVSPAFCVDESHPYFRFSKKSSFFYSTFTVYVVYRDTAGKVRASAFQSSSDAKIFPGSWSLSAISPLAANIPLVAGGKAATVQLYIKGGEGISQFDNVMVDPYRTR